MYKNNMVVLDNSDVKTLFLGALVFTNWKEKLEVSDVNKIIKDGDELTNATTDN